MNIFTARNMKQCAKRALQQKNQDYRKTVLFHEAVLLGALLLVQLLSLLTNSMAGDTGGLSGIGTRSIIGTIQSAVSLTVTLLMPFWSIGLVYTSTQVARGETVDRPMLLEGFRRFGIVLRYYLMMILIGLAILMVTVYITMMLAEFIPVSENLVNSVVSVDLNAIQDPAQLMEALPWGDLLAVILSIAGIFAVTFYGLYLHISYRLFASSYLVMDEECPGAAAAMSASNRLTKGYKWKLLKLDLSFWWYYLLQFAAGLLVYGNVILAALGVELPMDPGIADLLFYILYIGATLAIAWFAGAYINTTHACAYQQILAPSVLPEE